MTKVALKNNLLKYLIENQQQTDFAESKAVAKLIKIDDIFNILYKELKII